MEINAIINAILTCGSAVLFVIAALTALTNIIVEVFKSLLTKIPTSILVFVVSIALSVLALVVAGAALEITLTWYHWVGSLILGIVVAYAAMGNFDKLKETFERLQEYKK